MDKPRLQTFARAHTFDQFIASPTRITENTQSTIDLIFWNNFPRVVASGVVPLSISDHSPILCVKQVSQNLADIIAMSITAPTNITIKRVLLTI